VKVFALVTKLGELGENNSSNKNLAGPERVSKIGVFFENGSEFFDNV
jgi:hypothetical protein